MSYARSTLVCFTLLILAISTPALADSVLTTASAGKVSTETGDLRKLTCTVGKELELTLRDGEKVQLDCTTTSHGAVVCTVGFRKVDGKSVVENVLFHPESGACTRGGTDAVRCRGALSQVTYLPYVAVTTWTLEGDKAFRGPVVVLTGPNTFSAAEDFVVALHASGRAKVVGERTSGSTGQPLRIDLPGGGGARICTKWDSYPDGREFVGVGIIPDVEVHITPQDIADDKDRVLEAGLDVIRRVKSEE